MKKLKHKYYFDNTYRINYVFLLNVKNDAQVEKILKEKYNKTYKFYLEEKSKRDVSIENCGGCNIQGIHRQIIIVRSMEDYDSAYWYAALAHECLHAVMDVFRNRGVEYDIKSDNEHFTYYMDSLIRNALEK